MLWRCCLGYTFLLYGINIPHMYPLRAMKKENWLCDFFSSTRWLILAGQSIYKGLKRLLGEYLSTFYKTADDLMYQRNQVSHCELSLNIITLYLWQSLFSEELQPFYRHYVINPQSIPGCNMANMSLFPFLFFLCGNLQVSYGTQLPDSYLISYTMKRARGLTFHNVPCFLVGFKRMSRFVCCLVFGVSSFSSPLRIFFIVGAACSSTCSLPPLL